MLGCKSLETELNNQAKIVLIAFTPSCVTRVINRKRLWYGAYNKSQLGFCIQGNKNSSTPSTIIFFSQMLDNKGNRRIITTGQIVRARRILPWLNCWKRSTGSTIFHILKLRCKIKKRQNCNQESDNPITQTSKNCHF